MHNKFIDLHCHSILKPYSKSFKVKDGGGDNSNDSKDEHSVWHQKKSNIVDKPINSVTSLTKFTQSDFTTSFDGGVRLMVISIDPMERRLVTRRNGKSHLKWGLGILLKNFVTGIGLKRIRYLAENLKGDYYSDLIKARNYVEQLNSTPHSSNKRYTVLKEFPTQGLGQDTLYIIYGIEGGHVFNTDKPNVLDRVEDMKSWKYPPCWVSLAHHFENGLCTQAISFTGFFPKLAYKQKPNPNKGLEPLGVNVANKLLETSEGLRRILVDVKHMNLQSRKEYYKIAKRLKAPIVVSHGAMTFKDSPQEFNSEINFYNDELITIARSKGIFGIQLDSRRLKYAKKLGREGKPIKFRTTRTFRQAWKTKTGKKFKRRLYKRAFYIWKQVSYYAELLDKYDEFDGKIWSFQSIGSDFDGIVNPLDGFWTHLDFELMLHYVKLNIQQYIKSGYWSSLKDVNRMDEQTIYQNFIYNNAKEFLKQNFVIKHP